MKSFIAAMLLALPALSQQLSIGGIVTNEKTGQPIPRALVTIMHEFMAPAENPDHPEAQKFEQMNRTSFTDAGGRFQFTSLPEGDYSIGAEKPQYVAVPPGENTEQSSNIHLTSSVDNIALKLSPLGVITGTITDQDGLPLPNITVSILSSRIQNGIRQLQSTRSTTTDDRGVYRDWNLAPGRYFVKAASPGGSLEYVGSATPIPGDESFAPVYFGGSSSVDSASPVDVGAGAEVRADFTLKMETAWRVTGELNGFTPHTPITFELLNASGEATAVHDSVNGDVGRFAVGPVVPGSYTLRATQGKSVAEAAITVESNDVTGISISLSPAVDIGIDTRFTNTPPAPEAQTSSLRGAQRMNACSVTLIPRFVSSFRYSVSPQRNGDTFVLRNVMPGKYFVLPGCGQAWIQSAMSGTQDLGIDPILTVASGIAPPPIEIVATWGGGIVRGTLNNAGNPLSPPWIVLVPQFPSPEGPKLSVAIPDAGHPGSRLFTFVGLAPGTWSAWAFANNDVEFRNPEFIRTLTGGTTVQVDGANPTDLTIESVVH